MHVPPDAYDAEYFAAHCGPIPYERGDFGWEQLFGRVADAIVARYAPGSVLDAGCAIGFLVEALRERGVDAEGVDISAYAIAQAPDELKPYLRVGSVAEELERDYDLIACIEVLEHVSEEEAAAAVASFARHTSRVLFSSTPDDADEPTHVNVRPARYWVELFARNGLFPALDTDAGFVTPHAIVFERGDPALFAAGVEPLLRSDRPLLEQLARERERADRLERERDELGQRAEELERRRSELVAQRESLKTVLRTAERDAAEWRAWQERGGWRIFTALVGLRLRLAPTGTRRDHALRASLRGTANVLERRVRRPGLGVRAPGATGRSAVLFLSGCPGDAYRYRGEHQAAKLDARRRLRRQRAPGHGRPGRGARALQRLRPAPGGVGRHDRPLPGARPGAGQARRLRHGRSRLRPVGGAVRRRAGRHDRGRARAVQGRASIATGERCARWAPRP